MKALGEKRTALDPFPRAVQFLTLGGAAPRGAARSRGKAFAKTVIGRAGERASGALECACRFAGLPAATARDRLR